VGASPRIARSSNAYWRIVAFVVSMAVASPTISQQVPTIDTEDATLGSASVGRGHVHPLIALDVRNGDFARGNTTTMPQI
jgi:hypothetical protein